MQDTAIQSRYYDPRILISHKIGKLVNYTTKISQINGKKDFPTMTSSNGNIFRITGHFWPA